MAKGSGTTRSGGPGSPRGLSESERSIISATERAFSGPVLAEASSEFDTQIEKDIKAIQTATFANRGGGMWELNTPHADVSILLNEDYMGGRFYSINGFGAENVRTGDYSSDSVSRRFSSLNAAKAAAKEELERYYRQVNS